VLDLREEKAWQQLTEADMQKGMAEYNAFTESIKKSGNYVGGEALPTHQYRTSVRVRSGTSLQDGRTLRRDEGAAGRLLPDQGEGPERRGAGGVGGSPGAKHGIVEVRPIMEFEQP